MCLFFFLSHRRPPRATSPDTLCPDTTLFRSIGHLPIRTRGTFGGSVVHGDPAAEWPLLCSALDARLTLMSEAGTRTVPVDDFYVGFLTTCMAADELLVGIHFDRPPMGASLTEFSDRKSTRLNSSH